MKKNRIQSIVVVGLFIIIIIAIIYFISPNENQLQLQVIKAPNVDLSVAPNFNISKYTGTWYELARFDNSFESGCSCVTANYVNAGDNIDILNTCYKNNAYSSIKGKAYYTDTPGILMVQFFQFVKSEYRIVYVDTKYENAIVTNSEQSQLWLLSRQYSEQNRIKLLKIADDKGYQIDKLIITEGC